MIAFFAAGVLQTPLFRRHQNNMMPNSHRGPSQWRCKTAHGSNDDECHEFQRSETLNGHEYESTTPEAEDETEAEAPCPDHPHD